MQTDLLGISELGPLQRRGCTALQLYPYAETIDSQRRLRRRAGQYRLESHRGGQVRRAAALLSVLVTSDGFRVTYAQIKAAEPHREPAELPSVHCDVCLHHHPALPRVYEQRPDWPGRLADPDSAVPLPNDWVHADCVGRVGSFFRGQENYRPGCYAEVATRQHHSSYQR